jgi:hypothetical protein
MKLNITQPREAIKWHREFDEAPPTDLPDWARDWIVNALAPRTVVNEQYRRMGWDLDADIAKAAGAFHEDPDARYSLEDASRDLNRAWRRLMRRYALYEAWRVESRMWEVEQRIWKGLRPEQKKMHINPRPFHYWRWKDLFVWRLGIAVMGGYALLASSSGLVEILVRLSQHGWQFWLAALTASVGLSLFLSLVEVQRRVGQRPWWSVLFRRAASVTMCGVLWALPMAALQYLAGPSLCYPPSPVFVLLCAASALLLGHIFQVFWQDKPIAEPL